MLDQTQLQAAVTGGTAGKTKAAGMSAEQNRVANQLRAQYRGNWNVNGQDRAKELAGMLVGKGVTDISKMKFSDWKDYDVKLESGAANESGEQAYEQVKGKGRGIDFGNGTVIGNLSNSWTPVEGIFHESGKGSEIGWSAEGKGNVGFVVAERNGKPVIVPVGGSSSDRGEILQVGSMLANVVLPGIGAAGALGSALGLSGTAATAVGQGLISSGIAAVGGASGGDILKAGLGGAAGAGIGGLANAAGLGPALSGAAGNLAGGLISGQDPRKALLGALIGGASSAAGGAVAPGNQFGQTLVKLLLQRALTGAVKKGG